MLVTMSITLTDVVVQKPQPLSCFLLPIVFSEEKHTVSASVFYRYQIAQAGYREPITMEDLGCSSFVCS